MERRQRRWSEAPGALWFDRPRNPCVGHGPLAAPRVAESAAYSREGSSDGLPEPRSSVRKKRSETPAASALKLVPMQRLKRSMFGAGAYVIKGAAIVTDCLRHVSGRLLTRHGARKGPKHGVQTYSIGGRARGRPGIDAAMVPPTGLPKVTWPYSTRAGRFAPERASPPFDAPWATLRASTGH